MSVNPATCTIKSAVGLQIGDPVLDLSRPGVYITDIILSEPVNIQEISFRNYYTAYLTVRVQQHKSGSAKWVTCLKNHCLMPNPHAEAGSHDFFSIYRQQMSAEPDNATAVRLILRQPSSEWLSFSVEEVQIDPFLNEGLPEPDTVSSSIQQMWALTEIMQASQNAASIGRFDVDGSYDVTLLSHT